MYGGLPYAGGPYAGAGLVAADVSSTDIVPTLAVEIAFTTGALEAPVWVDVTGDVREWNVSRGRNRELERMQPGRATVTFGNLSRQYDSTNVSGPWFGNLRPMRRLRIRETFNGTTFSRFDGFVDRWQLDYPMTGKDATATVTATDAFKIFNRTDLPRSVYTTTVEADAPLVWWRLDETLDKFRYGAALNDGTGGSTYDGTFVGSPRVGQQGLIVHDPGTAMLTQSAFAAQDTPLQGVSIPNATLNLLGITAFSVEAWVRMDEGGAFTGHVWTVSRAADDPIHMALGYYDPTGLGTERSFTFEAVNSAFTLVYGVKTPALSVTPGDIHHVVAAVETGGQMAIWLDGVRYTTAASGVTGTSLSAVTRPSGGDFRVGHENSTNADPANNWQGTIDEVAVYSTPLSAASVAAHYAAGAAPWQGDLGGARAARVLDLVGLPTDMRDLAAGTLTLQSAELGMTALEHLQKIAETEIGGVLYTTADGKVRFWDETTVAARAPHPVVFGDGSGEVGYRAITFDDGDTVIRNRATVSRLNGVAKTDEDTASVDEFGRFDFTLDGLLHQSDTHSATYASFVVDEYKDPRRRVSGMSFGPVGPDHAADWWPSILGRELSESIVVRSRPVGGGVPFQQLCVIEGMEHAGAPGANRRTVRWKLSPEFTTNPTELPEFSWGDVDGVTWGSLASYEWGSIGSWP